MPTEQPHIRDWHMLVKNRLIYFTSILSRLRGWHMPTGNNKAFATGSPFAW